MREIRFRAWLEPENRMERGYFGLRSDGEPSFQSNLEGFKVTLMQFTGLKDKNGREIYEGDILGNPENGMKSDPVRFREGCFCYGGNTILAIHSWNVAHLVVLGNIYEKKTTVPLPPAP